MAKIQRLGRNSAIAVVNMVTAISNDIPLPEGVILRDESEMVIWRQFTRARTSNDWRDCDLILLAKAVRIEGDIRKYQGMLDETGAIMQNPRGTPIPNPLFAIVDTLQRQQLAVIRSLSLSQTPTDPRTQSAAAIEQNKLRSIMHGTDDLIPRQK